MKKSVMAAVAATAVLGILGTGCNNTPSAKLDSDIDTVSYEIGMMMAPSEQELTNYLTQGGADSTAAAEFLKGYIEAVSKKGDKKKVAYYMGLMQGLQTGMGMEQMEQQVFNGDSTKHLSVSNFLAGFAAYSQNKTALKVGGKVITKEDAQKRVMDFMFGKTKKESAEFMKAVAKKPGVKSLGQGVYGKEISKGTSTEKPAADSKVTIKYEGKLVSGKVFDSSKQGPDGTATIPLTSVIKGWQIAIPQMTIGSTWEIYIPAELAYGERGGGAIPPYSALIFTVTVVKAEANTPAKGEQTQVLSAEDIQKAIGGQQK